MWRRTVIIISRVGIDANIAIHSLFFLGPSAIERLPVQLAFDAGHDKPHLIQVGIERLHNGHEF